MSISASQAGDCASWTISASVTRPPTSDFTPQGTVAFTLSDGRSQRQTLSAGTASATFSGLANGLVVATGSYSGDAQFSPTSMSTRFTVNCPPPTTVAPTTTTKPPPPPTTTATTSNIPTTTLAPSTTTSVDTTTTDSTTTTSSTTSTTNVEDTTTTSSTTVAPPPAGRLHNPTLVAVTPDGKRSGPPGVGLDVSGVDYPPSCATVYVFFEKARLGSTGTGGSGRMSIGGLSIPGDASVGPHRVSSSCDSSGTPTEREAAFRVTKSSVHRSSFLTSLNEPRQVAFTAKGVAYSALLTALLFLLLGFPSQLFNATLQEHYEEVRGWFHLRRPLSEVVQNANQRLLFPLFLATGGVLYALLTPEFGFNLSSLALALGLAVAVAVTTIGFALPAVAFFGMRYRDRGQILVMPGTVLVGAGLVLVSRLAHLQPGYLYGLLAVVVFHHDLDQRTSGRLAAVSSLLVMVLAVVAWFARVPVTGATMRPGVGFWLVVLESALAGTFLIGLESTVVGLLPMRFLDGSRVREWSRAAWVALFAFGVFSVIEVLVAPGSGYVGHTSTPVVVAVAVLYLAFALGSVAFWGYFRYRPARFPSHLGEDDLQAEGDYDIR
jgi:Bacterial Ig-like domain (group 3)